MNRYSKPLVLCFLMGIAYIITEIFGRWVIGGMVDYSWGHYTQSYLSLTGWTSFWMIPVGGLCGVLMNKLSEWNWSKDLPVLVQALLGSVLICLPIEFVSGLILNIWLNFGLWDYSEIHINIPGLKFIASPPNILGQISLLSGIVFFFLYPFAVWLDDILCVLLFKEGQPYHVLENYKRMFQFKKLQY